MNWEKLMSRRFFDSSIIQSRQTAFLSMLGMGLGCFALIISLSVMNGFENLVYNKLKGFEGDLSIHGNFQEIPTIDLEGVDQTMPFIERKAIIGTEQTKQIVTIKAVDEKTLGSFYRFPLIGQSKFPKNGQIIIGEGLAKRIDKTIGDSLSIYSPLDHSIGFSLPNIKFVEISGIFSTKTLDYDDRYSFIPFSDGTKLFKRKLGYDGVDVRIFEGHELTNIKSRLKKLFDDQTEITSWIEKNQSLIDAMKMERLATIIILSLIFLVAAFNLASSLTLLSIKKIREVGILKVLGANKYSILKIMVLIGFNKAGKGAVFGYLAGIIIVLTQKRFQFIPIPSDIYFTNALPMVLYLRDLITIAIISIIFIFVSSLISGRKIADLDSQEALNWMK